MAPRVSASFTFAERGAPAPARQLGLARLGGAGGVQLVRRVDETCPLCTGGGGGRGVQDKPPRPRGLSSRGRSGPREMAGPGEREREMCVRFVRGGGDMCVRIVPEGGGGGLEKWLDPVAKVEEAGRALPVRARALCVEGVAVPRELHHAVREPAAARGAQRKVNVVQRKVNVVHAMFAWSARRVVGTLRAAAQRPCTGDRHTAAAAATCPVVRKEGRDVSSWYGREGGGGGGGGGARPVEERVEGVGRRRLAVAAVGGVHAHARAALHLEREREMCVRFVRGGGDMCVRIVPEGGGGVTEKRPSDTVHASMSTWRPPRLSAAGRDARGCGRCAAAREGAESCAQCRRARENATRGPGTCGGRGTAGPPRCDRRVRPTSGASSGGRRACRRATSGASACARSESSARRGRSPALHNLRDVQHLSAFQNPERAFKIQNGLSKSRTGCVPPGRGRR